MVYEHTQDISLIDCHLLIDLKKYIGGKELCATEY
jgi:hypothetical protein